MGACRRVLVLLLLSCASSWAVAQASSVSVLMCGREFQSGLVYASAAGALVICGADGDGRPLAAYVGLVPLPGSGAPDGDGVAAGVAIGGAVLGVMAVAFGIRLLRNFLNSSSEG
ncbi:major capsid protein [Paraburkholderia flava]|uniref:major capsid protein n=1 Tax=Paraburkholderia flava TaxID=2547393 RepID=UPI001F0DCE29|nr:major capsid protein [Paraburkholderia flava]